MGPRVRGVLIVASVLLVGAFLGSALSQWSDESTVIPAVPGSFSRFGVTERVRVEVLNGGGRAGMARATDALRDRGFDVVDFGNAGSFDNDSSVVLSRAGELAWARAVADALGIRQVRIEPDSNLYLDVTVVLGEVWEPTVVEELPDPEPAWWSPRRWLRRPGAPPDARLADPAPNGGE